MWFDRRGGWRRLAAAALAGIAAGLISLPGEAASGKHHRRSKPSPPAVESDVGAVTAAADALGIHGSASFYGPGFRGRRSASGEHFDPREFTAASNRFPLGTWVAVERLDTGRCAVVRVNDRMHARNRRRVIDLSRAAAEHLRMISAGVVLVRAYPVDGPDAACRAEGDEGE